MDKHNIRQILIYVGVTGNANRKVSGPSGIAAPKGNQIIKRNITHKRKQLTVSLYKAIVMSHLEYFIQVLRPEKDM